MSDTALNMMDRIRTLTDDRNQAQYEVSGTRMLEMLSSRVVQTVSELAVGDDERSGLVTLASGTTDYTLSLGAAYLTGVNSVVFNDTSSSVTTNTPLEKLSPEQMVRQQSYSNQGKPAYWSLRENYDQSLTLTVWPTPNASCDGMALDVWTTDASSGVPLTTTTLYMQNTLLRSIEKAVAAECVQSMTPESLSKRGINPAVANQWLLDWQRGIALERARLFRLRRGQNVALRRA